LPTQKENSFYSWFKVVPKNYLRIPKSKKLKDCFLGEKENFLDFTVKHFDCFLGENEFFLEKSKSFLEISSRA